ncbi:MAG: hypothetical protein ABII00_11010 [Elusimicrobiota bacterium]
MSRDADKPATKSDIGRLDRKIDGVDSRLDRKIDRVAMELGRTQTQMREMEQRLGARMDAGFDRVTDVIDSFAGKIETYSRETATIPKTLDRHGDKLRDHERRIDRLEASRDG